MHLDYTKVIILILWWRNFQLEYWRTFQLVSTAFGDLGLWNGRKQGYQILGDNIAGILQSTQYDAEWYGDGYDIRGRMSHHDGTNYVLYRVAENRDDAEQIAAKIYNYEIDENGFRQVTRSLHPYVAAVYGWKTLQDNLVQVKSL